MFVFCPPSRFKESFKEVDLKQMDYFQFGSVRLNKVFIIVLGRIIFLDEKTKTSRSVVKKRTKRKFSIIYKRCRLCSLIKDT